MFDKMFLDSLTSCGIERSHADTVNEYRIKRFLGLNVSTIHQMPTCDLVQPQGSFTTLIS